MLVNAGTSGCAIQVASTSVVRNHGRAKPIPESWIPKNLILFLLIPTLPPPPHAPSNTDGYMNGRMDGKMDRRERQNRRS